MIKKQKLDDAFVDEMGEVAFYNTKGNMPDWWYDKEPHWTKGQVKEIKCDKNKCEEDLDICERCATEYDPIGQCNCER